MFCPNCGNILVDEAKFCNQCGTPITPIAVQQPAPESSRLKSDDVERCARDMKESRSDSSTPQAQPESQVQPEPVYQQAQPEPQVQPEMQYQQAQPESQVQPEQQTYRQAPEWQMYQQGQPEPQMYQFAPEPMVEKKPRKWKKWAIIGGSAAAACIAVLVVVFVAGAQIRNFFNSMKDPADYYHIVESDHIENVDNMLLNAYDSSMGSVYGNSSQDVTINLKLDQSVIAMISAYSSNSNVDYSKLSDITLNTKIGAQELKKFAFTGELFASGEKLFDAAFFSDTETGKSYLSIPMLAQSFLQISKNDTKTEDVMPGAGTQFGGIKDLAKFAKYFPNEEKLKEIVKRYNDLVIGMLTDVEKNSGDLTVDGVSESCTVLDVKITGDKLVEILKAICEQLKNDNDIREVYNLFNSTLTYEQAIDQLSSIIDMSNIPTLISGIDMKVYVDSKGIVIGRDISIRDANNVYNLFLGLPRSNGLFALEVSVSMNGQKKKMISGSGTYSGDDLKGVVSITNDDGNTASLEIERFDLGALNKGELDASFAYMLPTGSGLGSGAKIQIDVKTNLSDFDAKASVIFAGKSLGSLELTGGKSSYPSEAEPSSSDKIYDANDPVQAKQFVEELHLPEWGERVKASTGIDVTSYIQKLLSIFDRFDTFKDYAIPDMSGTGYAS